MTRRTQAEKTSGFGGWQNRQGRGPQCGYGVPMNRSKQGGKLYMVMVIVAIVVSVVLGLFSSRLPEMDIMQQLAVSETMWLMPVLVFLVIDRFEPLRGMKLKPIGFPTILWILLFTVLLMPLMTLLNLLTQFVVPNAAQAGLVESTALPIWISLLYMASLPAIIEEFCFRGALFQYFRPCGLWKTALLTGLMFGLAHMNLNQFLYAFVIGIFFALLNEATGSLYASMLAHSVINAVNVLEVFIAVSNLPENLVGVYEDAEAATASVSSLSLVVWIILAVVAGACTVLAVVVMKHIARIRGNEQKFSDALKGKDRLRGKEGRVFSWQMLVGILAPVVFMGIMMVRGV